MKTRRDEICSKSGAKMKVRTARTVLIYSRTAQDTVWGPVVGLGAKLLINIRKPKTAKLTQEGKFTGPRFTV